MLGLGRGEIFGEDDGHDEDDSHDGEEGSKLLEEEEQDIGVRWGEARQGDKRGGRAGWPRGVGGRGRSSTAKADREDPKALLDGVAIADLVGIFFKGRYVGALMMVLRSGGGEEVDEGFGSSDQSRHGAWGDFFLDSATALFSGATPMGLLGW
ncbi:hypothetical protein NL676_035008 [Syzygium grande]|nr:hypothetical protein NL676_035008 [Syzygium grande]